MLLMTFTVKRKTFFFFFVRLQLVKMPDARNLTVGNSMVKHSPRIGTLNDLNLDLEDSNQNFSHHTSFTKAAPAYQV